MSKTKKAKKPAFIIPVISTEEGLAASANRYIEVELELKRLTTEHEQKIAALNAEFDKATEELVAQRERLVGSCHLYCENHRDLFTEEKRSRDYRNARVGFRWHPVKVDKIAGKDTFDAIAERLEELAWGEKYVGYKGPSLLKDELIKDQATLTDKQLREAGIKFTKDESFFIESAFESAENVTIKTEAAA